MAVAEFLENVDLEALGLGGGESRVIGAGDLSPLPLMMTPEKAEFVSEGMRLRGRVEQQVDAIAGSANKVISGVVDSSFGVLKAFLPMQNTVQSPTDISSSTSPQGESSAPWNTMRPGFGLLRRESGFSIASIAASLPGGSGSLRTKSLLGEGEESGQQLVSVSRPGSVKSAKSTGVEDGSDEESEDGEGSGEEEEGEEGEEDEEEGSGYEGLDQVGGGGHDTRSIRSFESMMSASAKERERKVQEANASAAARKSLSDRLAGMPGLGRLHSDSSHKVTIFS